MGAANELVADLKRCARFSKATHPSWSETMRRAAEMIDELVTQVKQLEHRYKSKWISCEDCLPEEGEDVLVWYEYFRYGSYNRMFRTYGIGYQYNGKWNVSGTRSKCIAWQPLPPRYRCRPKKKSKELAEEDIKGEG